MKYERFCFSASADPVFVSQIHRGEQDRGDEQKRLQRTSRRHTFVSRVRQAQRISAEDIHKHFYTPVCFALLLESRTLNTGSVSASAQRCKYL